MAMLAGHLTSQEQEEKDRQEQEEKDRLEEEKKSKAKEQGQSWISPISRVVILDMNSQ